MTYKYEDLTESGYVNINLSCKDHKRFLHKKRKVGKIFYSKDKHTHTRSTLFHIIVDENIRYFIFFLPSILVEGLPRTIKATRNVWFERKYGHFSKDTVHFSSNSDFEKHILKFIDK